jgi:hypothetical protein
MRRISALLAAVAASAFATLPSLAPITPPRGTALRRGRRHQETIVDRSARHQANAEIRRWNAEIDRKNAAKRAWKGIAS